ncbi:MAG: NAD(P)/FAD-dependent oxidoreductase [Paracoccaceae bacterium]
MNDFLVIGGGIAGISAAARLSRLGNVTVLEAESGLGYHASGRSAAMFAETYGSPSTVALNKASRNYLMSADGGVLSPRGMMVIGTADSDAEFAHDLGAMAMEPMSFNVARAIVPILNSEVITGIGYHEDSMDVDTDRLIQNFARTVRAHGGKVLTKEKVTEIARTAGGWRVKTGHSEYTASVLINAAGPWVDAIAVMAGIAPIGFAPLRRSIARIPAPAELDISKWPLIFGAGESWYAKPDAGKLLVSPADEDPVLPHDAWPDDMVLAEGIARYEAVVTVPVTRLETSWAGLRTFSPDRSLVIGPDASVPSFLWVAGKGGYGFQTSPAAGQLVADIVAGQNSELDAATVLSLSPLRFG